MVHINSRTVTVDDVLRANPDQQIPLLERLRAEAQEPVTDPNIRLSDTWEGLSLTVDTRLETAKRARAVLEELTETSNSHLAHFARAILNQICLSSKSAYVSQEVRGPCEWAFIDMGAV